MPSSTALATSETSARVGTGLVIMDSIICVAVMVSLLRSRAARIIFFCSAGTAASPTSTARSPRATMMPSEASRISSRLATASVRSILAISSAAQPAARMSWRAMYMSAALLGKDTRRSPTPMSRGGADVVHVLGGERGRGEPAALAVDALVVGQLAADLDDGVDLVADHALHGELEAAVVEQQHVARLHVLGQVLVVEADALGVAELAAGVEDEGASRVSVTRPSSNLPTRILGPCRSARMPIGRPARAEASRMVSARATWSSGLPWEKFIRTTSGPACLMRSRVGGRTRRGRGWRRSWCGGTSGLLRSLACPAF